MQAGPKTVMFSPAESDGIEYLDIVRHSPQVHRLPITVIVSAVCRLTAVHVERTKTKQRCTLKIELLSFFSFSPLW